MKTETNPRATDSVQNKVLTFTRSALNVNLGKPAACVWETSVIGWDITHWRTDAAGTWHPYRHAFTELFNESRAIAARFKRSMAE